MLGSRLRGNDTGAFVQDSPWCVIPAKTAVQKVSFLRKQESRKE